jgi:hypothetical protein
VNAARQLPLPQLRQQRGEPRAGQSRVAPRESRIAQQHTNSNYLMKRHFHNACSSHCGVWSDLLRSTLRRGRVLLFAACCDTSVSQPLRNGAQCMTLYTVYSIAMRTGRMIVASRCGGKTSDSTRITSSVPQLTALLRVLQCSRWL